MSFIFSVLQNKADLDLWHRMAVGKIFSRTGNVLYHDIFSYFPVKTLWVDHEWLSGVIFYNLGHYFGDSGILFLKIFIYFGILVLIYKTHKLMQSRAESNNNIVFYILVFIALTPGLGSVLRCQAFTYLFFTLWIYVLERVRRGENRLIWILPATILIWANLHGGFLAGLGLILFYAVGEFLNKKSYLKYIGILALCLPVTLINPYGFKYWTYLAEAVTMQKPFVSEWNAFNFSGNFFEDIGFKIFVLIFVFSMIYKIILKYKNSASQKFDFVEIITLFVTLILSLLHVRHAVFFSIAASVYCYKYYSSLIKLILLKVNLFKNISEKTLNLLSFSGLAFIYILTAGFFAYTVVTEPFLIKLNYYPTKAVEFIKINKLNGNLLVPFNWGSYALWKLYPQNHISIDGRYEETYTNEAFADISKITFRQKDWKKTFYKYRHDVILTEKDSAFEKELRKLKDLKPVYEDEKAVIFVPVSIPYKNWLKPNRDENYYIKTKYENDINF